MKDCNVAMCITKDSLNPADRLMYQFRSATGTINSIGLIVASIASKQLASPPDLLLLDVRYGSGAFMKSLNDAKVLLSHLSAVIKDHGVDCIGKLTRTKQPNGMSIGNKFEVAEAVSIITNTVNEEYWDKRALAEQKELVINFMASLMNRLFPKNISFWKKIGFEKFRNGEVQQGFRKILSAHKVSDYIVENLCKDPNFLIRNLRKHSIRSNKEGVLVKIDQKNLGYIVNFYFGAGGNVFSKEINNDCGFILRKRIGDHVQVSSELCWVFDNPQVMDDDLGMRIRECFYIR
jgi:pyrimidine-nucleoside phosphorylase